MQTSLGIARSRVEAHYIGPRARIRLFSPLRTLAAVPVILAFGCTGLAGPDTATPNIKIQMRASVNGTERASVELSGLTAQDLSALRAAGLNDDEWNELLRVTVLDEDGNGEFDMPSVLGSYVIENDGLLRFSPMFPFDLGRQYSVRFNPNRLPERKMGPVEPVTTVVALPRPDVEPTVVVQRIFPSGDRVPENQLKFYLHFSAPMSRANGLEYVSLIDARGRIVEDPFLPFGTEFWDLDRLRYTVFFDPGRIKRGLELNERLGRPLQEGETYTLVVDPAWPDAEGNPLQTPFEKRFTVGPADTTALDISAWRLRVPSSGSTQRLVVSFPEPLDHALMQRGLGVEDESGNFVEGEVEVGNWETRWMFTPIRPWTSGVYSLIALSILEDLAGNRIGIPFERNTFGGVSEPETSERFTVRFEIR